MEEVDQQAPHWIGGVEPARELLTASGTEILEMECLEQGGRLRDLIQAYRTDASLRDELKKFSSLAANDKPVFFIGMGASFCSSFGGSVLLETHGRLSFSIDAGEWLHYGRSVWDAAGLSVLLTTSGESAELVAFFRAAEANKLGLICNNSASACWRLAENKLPILAGPEYGNATKTFTNATAASIIVASEILGLPWEEDAERVADIFAASIDPIFALRGELEAFCRGAANTEIIGRGAAYGSAIMSALCIREMSGHRAAAHTGAGFKHGPNLDVDASHVAIIFALGRVAELGTRLAEECVRRGGKVVLVSTEQRSPAERLFPVQVTAIPEPWESITSILVPQALTLGMVEQNGCRLPPRFRYGVMEQ